MKEREEDYLLNLLLLFYFSAILIYNTTMTEIIEKRSYGIELCKFINYIKQKYNINLYYHHTDNNYIVLGSFYNEFYSNQKILYLVDQINEESLLKTLSIKAITNIPKGGTFLSITFLIPKEKIDTIVTYLKLIR